ncbi:MAG: hypothetical protein LIR50_07145 [Bacillota bacterium]|nr:hypothetical protein [Bacillota bacterium]
MKKKVFRERQKELQEVINKMWDKKIHDMAEEAIEIHKEIVKKKTSTKKKESK